MQLCAVSSACLSLCLLLGSLGCKRHAPAPPPANVARPAVAEPASPPPSAGPVASAGQTMANRAAAKAANAQGMKAYRAKDYPTATDRFRAAIAADASFPLPHYNLACVAALTGDKKTALSELDWLARSPDPQARRTLKKASEDADLKSLADDKEAQKILLWSGVLPGYRAQILDTQISEAEAKPLKANAKDHPSDCDSAFTAVGGVKGELAADRPGSETFLFSLAEGGLLLDAAGKPIAQGMPFDPDCVGGSQSGLTRISAGQVIADEDPEYLVYYSGGGHGDALTESLDVLKRRGDKLVSILSVKIDGADKDEVSLPALGALEVRESGQKQSVRKQWDPTKFEFVEVKDPSGSGAAATPEEVVDHVNGWTADSAFLSYKRSESIDESDSGDGPRLVVGFGVVKDASSGREQEHVLALTGEPKKAEKKKYGAYPQKAAWKAWEQQHPTHCFPGRSSPDGKIKTEISILGSRKKQQGKWKKDAYAWWRSDDAMDDSDEQITLEITLVRDGKPAARMEYSSNAMLGGNLAGNVTLCWAPNSQRVAVVVVRDQAMMRDPGETTMLLPSLTPSTAEAAK